MRKYKLVDQDGYTRRGETGETYWLDGGWKRASGTGTEMCTDGVIHFYDHPKLAMVFNIIHANIMTPRMIMIEIDSPSAHDGLKGGCKAAKFVKEIPLPEITLEEKVAFSIRVSLKFYHCPEFAGWAEAWLSGKNRSEEAAEAAAWAAKSVVWADESAAKSAAAKSAAATAKAAAWAADSAAWAADSAAAWADEAAAEAAACAESAAAWAAEAAAWAAKAAAWAAESAAAWAAEAAARAARAAADSAAWAADSAAWAAHAEAWAADSATWAAELFIKAIEDNK